MAAAEAADVDRPEVERRLAAGDPLGQRPAGAAGGRDAEGVEAGADDRMPLISGASPRMKLPSGVKLSGPLISCLTPAVASAGTRASASSISGSK